MKSYSILGIQKEAIIQLECSPISPKKLKIIHTILFHNIRIKLARRLGDPDIFFTLNDDKPMPIPASVIAIDTTPRSPALDADEAVAGVNTSLMAYLLMADRCIPGSSQVLWYATSWIFSYE